MVVDTSDKNQFSYFYVLNLFMKVTRPELYRPWRSLTTCVSDSNIDNFDTISIEVINCVISLIAWTLWAFLYGWNFGNFRQYLSSWFSTELKIYIYDGFIRKISFRSIRVNPILIVKYIFLSNQIHLKWKLISIECCCGFCRITPKVHLFTKFRWLHR